MRQRKVHARPAAHGLADQGSLIDARVVQNGLKVLREVASVLVTVVAGRSAESAMVEGDYFVVSSKVGYLLPPDQRVAAGSVGECYRGAITVDLIVDRGVIDFDYWHIFISI